MDPGGAGDQRQQFFVGGCGSAVMAAGFPYAAAPDGASNFFGIGFLGVALAFGLTVLTMAFAVGHISGGHFNPAVSFGLWAGKKFSGSDLLPYIIAQVLGAILAGGLIYIIASGRAGGFALSGSNPLATNGFGEHSPGGYSLLACFLTEVVLTFIFLSSAEWICACGDWAVLDADPPDQHPDHQHLGEPSSQSRRGAVCGR